MTRMFILELKLAERRLIKVEPLVAIFRLGLNKENVGNDHMTHFSGGVTLNPKGLENDSQIPTVGLQKLHV